jgi:hypothetical protein
MKTVKLLVAGIALFLAGTMQAQVTVNVNIGTPPLWGPVGYTEARYYYLPDVEAYYDIQATMFICYVQGQWVHKTNLPSMYRSYDLYDGYKVVLVDYHGNVPYKDFEDHKAKYAKGYKGPAQKTYGENPGNGKKSGNGGDGKGQGSGHDNGKDKHK